MIFLQRILENNFVSQQQKRLRFNSIGAALLKISPRTQAMHAASPRIFQAAFFVKNINEF
jgi:hypothetical protein